MYNVIHVYIIGICVLQIIIVVSIITIFCQLFEFSSKCLSSQQKYFSVLSGDVLVT